MAKAFNEEIAPIVKQLIHHLSGFEEDSPQFIHLEKYFKSQFKNAGTMYFLHKKQIDNDIQSMGEKYAYHGFQVQAKALNLAYNKYIPEDINKSETFNRLNIVKFLLCMSHSPTQKFIKEPDKYDDIIKEETDDINWPEYLLDGLEKWEPNFNEASDSSDINSEGDEFENEEEVSTKDKEEQIVILEDFESEALVDFKANREELIFAAQHSWYNQPNVIIEPESDWEDANIGILWEKHLKERVNGLISIKHASILTEYKVLREIFWQLWEPHTSKAFKLEGNSIKPRPNVTISSVRSVAFESFMLQFVKYIEVLAFFRDFCQTLELNSEASCIPGTYLSYMQSLTTILCPVYKKLSDLEEIVRKQDETFTLLKLAERLRVIFEPVLILKKIHDEVVIDFKTYSTLECATNLLVRLHDSLHHSVNKLEQNLKLTLFLDSFYHYFMLIDSWLMKDDLADYKKEFILVNNHTIKKNINIQQDQQNVESEHRNDLWQIQFEARKDLSELCIKNTIMKIILEQVLQIGKNIHLLRILGKYNLLNDCSETIHEEFIRKSLEQIAKFNNMEFTNLDFKKPNIEHFEELLNDEPAYKTPIVCVDDCKTITEMDKLDNLVDQSDGLLMKAFEDYFVSQPEISCTTPIVCLFDQIDGITSSLFPVQKLFESILQGILKERFTVSGLMVKTLLIERKLDKLFEFLRHTFLFFDDLIFAFYRRFFEKIECGSENWGNEVWLTSHLQDILLDIHPEFYENCRVQVKEHWRNCFDTLEACNVINLHYDIQWPLNIIVDIRQVAMYKELFQFILKIKWSLYTINHLNFADLEPKKKPKKKIESNKRHKKSITQLKYLRFCLINIMNSIQHYIFGFVFSKCQMKFELDFEKASDLASIVQSHENFIVSIHAMVRAVRDCGQDKHGCNQLFSCVKMLKQLWTNLEHFTHHKLDECIQLYNKAYELLDPVINPVFLFDY